MVRKANTVIHEKIKSGLFQILLFQIWNHCYDCSFGINTDLLYQQRGRTSCETGFSQYTGPSVFYIGMFIRIPDAGKNLPPADVFLTDDGLIINGISYSSEQIEELTYMPVRNTLNKFPSYFFEIKTSDDAVFYFLDRDPTWKGESAAMKLLSNHPLFALKTKRREESSEGFPCLKSRNSYKKSTPNKILFYL